MAKFNIKVNPKKIPQLSRSEKFIMSPVLWNEDTPGGTDEFINDIKIAFKIAVNSTTDVSDADKKSAIEQMNRITASNARSEYIDEYGWLEYEQVR